MAKAKKDTALGGSRAGSGRKTKAITAMKQQIIQSTVGIDDKMGAAEYAFRLFVDTMRDQATPINVRLDCGREVMDRAWGRPTQRKEIKTDLLKAYEDFDTDGV